MRRGMPTQTFSSGNIMDTYTPSMSQCGWAQGSLFTGTLHCYARCMLGQVCVPACIHLTNRP